MGVLPRFQRPVAGCSPCATLVFLLDRRAARSLDAEILAERKREQACKKVRAGELSRARQLLTAAELAPGNEATCPPRRPRAAVGPPSLRLQLRRLCETHGGEEQRDLRACMRSISRDVPALELLAFAATALANADVPADIVTG